MGPRPRGGFMGPGQMPFGMPMMQYNQQMMRQGYPMNMMMPRGGPRGVVLISGNGRHISADAIWHAWYANGSGWAG